MTNATASETRAITTTAPAARSAERQRRRLLLRLSGNGAEAAAALWSFPLELSIGTQSRLEGTSERVLEP